MSQLKNYTNDHRYLLDMAGREAGFAHPVAITFNQLADPLLRASRKSELLPIDGVLIRDWAPYAAPSYAGIQFGMRVYEVEGIRFAFVQAVHNEQLNYWGMSFYVVDRKDYRRLYRIALSCRRDSEQASTAPVLPPEQAEILWKNTIGYLDSDNLQRIKEYGGRARRGVLLTGSPGNGKTMACRWIWEECRRRRWEWHLVTPDAYRQARQCSNAQVAVRQLFTVNRRGIVFFDDMDLALRDRETVGETEDQAVFLSAMDGIPVNEGVVFVFTTNCSLDLIDRAFKRPGRIDVMLHFKPPPPELRRELIQRWHADIRAGIDIEHAVATTGDFSFAEIEELKNLLIMRWLDASAWEWDWALHQFGINRNELNTRLRRQVGFGYTEPARNGAAPDGHEAAEGD
ncbi:MAG: ATP-binding protein [Gemmataceae bacterium]|nr:ATP-binding protein [Gemmataceae bacterium]